MKNLVLALCLLRGACVFAEVPNVPQVSYQDTRRLWCLVSVAETKRLTGPTYDWLTSRAAETSLPFDAFADNGKDEEFTVPLTVPAVYQDPKYSTEVAAQKLPALQVVRVVHIQATLNKVGAEKSQLTRIGVRIISGSSGKTVGNADAIQAENGHVLAQVKIDEPNSIQIECNLDTLLK